MWRYQHNGVSSTCQMSIILCYIFCLLVVVDNEFKRINLSLKNFSMDPNIEQL